MKRMNPRCLLFAALSLLIPVVALASGGEGHAQLTLTEILWEMGIKVLDVAILGFLAFKFLAKPLNSLAESRAEKVRRELDEAQSARREAEAELQAFRAKAGRIDQEIEELRRQTCVDIDKEQKLLFNEAKAAAESIRQHARDSIRQEMLKARDELHKEAVHLSASLARDLVSREMTDDDQHRLVGTHLKDMEEAR